MKSGKCPKCQSSKVYSKQSSMGYRSGLLIKIFTGTRLRDFVCTDCGYIESYVTDKNALKMIAAVWDSVSPGA